MSDRAQGILNIRSIQQIECTHAYNLANTPHCERLVPSDSKKLEEDRFDENVAQSLFSKGGLACDKNV